MAQQRPRPSSRGRRVGARTLPPSETTPPPMPPPTPPQPADANMSVVAGRPPAPGPPRATAAVQRRHLSWRVVAEAETAAAPVSVGGASGGWKYPPLKSAPSAAGSTSAVTSSAVSTPAATVPSAASTDVSPSPAAAATTVRPAAESA